MKRDRARRRSRPPRTDAVTARRTPLPLSALWLASRILPLHRISGRISPLNPRVAARVASTQAPRFPPCFALLASACRKSGPLRLMYGYRKRPHFGQVGVSMDVKAELKALYELQQLDSVLDAL